MKSADLQPGMVTAFHSNRDPHIVWPYLIVSKKKYTHDLRNHKVYPAGPNDHMGRGDSWSGYQTGLLAISMRQHDDRSPEFGADAAKIIELADVQTITGFGGELKDGDRVLGTWHLVTSMAHLHGTYAEWNAARRVRNAKIEAMAREHETERQARAERFAKLAERLARHGITPQNMYDREDPHVFKFSLDDTAKLLDLADYFFDLIGEND